MTPKIIGTTITCAFYESLTEETHELILVSWEWISMPFAMVLTNRYSILSQYETGCSFIKCLLHKNKKKNSLWKRTPLAHQRVHISTF